eukprot:EG_transcript_33137
MTDLHAGLSHRVAFLGALDLLLGLKLRRKRDVSGCAAAACGLLGAVLHSRWLVLVYALHMVLTFTHGLWHGVMVLSGGDARPPSGDGFGGPVVATPRQVNFSSMVAFTAVEALHLYVAVTVCRLCLALPHRHSTPDRPSSPPTLRPFTLPTPTMPNPAEEETPQPDRQRR